MFKKLLIITLLAGMFNLPSFAKDKKDIGNNINDKEYPSAEKVLPQKKAESEQPLTISGSV